MLKIDPERHPVRFLASIWQKRTGNQMTPKELGQLKLLIEALGPFTRDVIDWVLAPVNWWRFCQLARAEGRLHSAPPYPHIGFLLKQNRRALKIVRHELRHSKVAAHVNFCTSLDKVRYQQFKDLALVYADGLPERIAEIHKTRTLTDIQQMFISLVDDTIAAVVYSNINPHCCVRDHHRPSAVHSLRLGDDQQADRAVGTTPQIDEMIYDVQ